MASAIAFAYPKVRSWISTATSPSTTHASGMLIILGILAAVTDAQKPAAASHHDAPKASSPKDGSTGTSAQDSQQNQDMLYYLALGMLVSQGLIRLFGYISSRREAAAVAARKKDDDLVREKRKADLQTLADSTSPLLGSDTEDDDYEEESESESESDDEELEESEEEEDEEVDSESETEIQRRRRVLAAGDAEVKE
ncbi:hypothetical protein BGX29_007470 [Mortierella sp. GBA35]|nr:hypothetical protein BGX29_007470 [Mortierella sp. GBA35]KAF9099223.1 hypothetical protein BGX23_003458 [Mortierella sp. AD031]KAG0217738.1 hypothetical protein BGX33_009746 [Mortierella sp. NVP41]